MGGSLTLGHIRGIPIRAHFTLLIILPYLAFLMAARFSFVARQAGVDATQMLLPPLAWGLLLGVLLFACVLLHELGHSLLALRMGGRVRSITLMLLGGVSELQRLPPSPRVEGLVAVAGPLVSLGIGAGSLAAWAWLRMPPDLMFGLFYLGQINVVLGIFNLLPAFPMDGGRVLRALLSVRLSRVQATRVAGWAGTAFAALFVAAGLLSGNLLLALIGVFVWMGARAETAAVTQQERFKGLVVRDVMSPAPEAVEVHEPVEEAARRMARERIGVLPVAQGDELVGVVALRHIEALRADERARTPVQAIAKQDVPELRPDEPLVDALERMFEQRVQEAPVVESEELVGLLDTNELPRTLRLREMQTAARQSPVTARFAPPELDDRHPA